MKKLFIYFLIIGFFSASLIFVSCKKKEEDPAPVNQVPATTTSGTTTSGSTTGTTSGSTTSSTTTSGSTSSTTTSGTTSGTTSSTTTTSGSTSGSTSSSTSGTTSGSTTSSTTTSGTTTSSTTSSGSFNDGTGLITGKTVGGKSGNSVVVYINGPTNNLPSLRLVIATNGSTGTFTNANAVGTYADITYSSNEAYNSLYAGGSCSVTLTTNSNNRAAGTFTFKATNSASSSLSKTVTGSFDVSF